MDGMLSSVPFEPLSFTSAPSTDQLLAVVRAPFTEIADPLFRPKPGSSPSRFTTPGCKVTNCWKLRSISSSSRTACHRLCRPANCLWSQWLRIVLNFDGFIFRSRFQSGIDGAPLCDIEHDILIGEGFEVGSLDLNRIGSGGQVCGCEVALVVGLDNALCPLPLRVMVTVACGINAPVESVTVPVKVPSSSWLLAAVGARPARRRSTEKDRNWLGRHEP